MISHRSSGRGARRRSWRRSDVPVEEPRSRLERGGPPAAGGGDGGVMVVPRAVDLGKAGAGPDGGKITLHRDRVHEPGFDQQSSRARVVGERMARAADCRLQPVLAGEVDHVADVSRSGTAGDRLRLRGGIPIRRRPSQLLEAFISWAMQFSGHCVFSHADVRPGCTRPRGDSATACWFALPG